MDHGVQLGLRARKDFLASLDPRAHQVLLERQELLDQLVRQGHKAFPGMTGLQVRLDRLARLARLGLLDSRVPRDPKARKVWLDRQEQLVQQARQELLEPLVQQGQPDHKVPLGWMEPTEPPPV